MFGIAIRLMIFVCFGIAAVGLVGLGLSIYRSVKSKKKEQREKEALANAEKERREKEQKEADDIAKAAAEEKKRELSEEEKAEELRERTVKALENMSQRDLMNLMFAASFEGICTDHNRDFCGISLAELQSVDGEAFSELARKLRESMPDGIRTSLIETEELIVTIRNRTDDPSIIGWVDDYCAAIERTVENYLDLALAEEKNKQTVQAIKEVENSLSRMPDVLRGMLADTYSERALEASLNASSLDALSAHGLDRFGHAIKEEEVQSAGTSENLQEYDVTEPDAEKDDACSVGMGTPEERMNLYTALTRNIARMEEMEKMKIPRK